jgi:hypothetical protein
MYPALQQQQPLHDYSNRPGTYSLQIKKICFFCAGSSMGGMGYQQVSMWPQQQYPPPTPNSKNISS